MSEHKAHPEYAVGYWRAIDSLSLPAESSEPLRVGYEAAKRAKEILASNGFTETEPGEFSKTMVVR